MGRGFIWGGGGGAVKKVPLSLEELLAKKKAEQEPLSKVGSISVRVRGWYFDLKVWIKDV